MNVSSPAREVIRLEGITKVYPMGGGSVAALRGVSLLFLAGEYVAIMGSSGSGKSTLLNLLGCLDTPTSGHYLLEGTDVAGMTDRQLSALRRSRFGFVFQSFNLIAQISVLENIEVPLFYQGRGRRECRERALALAAMVGLEHRVRHRPSELSGGQMQRVAIARALANDPSVILADEPTGNLDSKTGAEIMTTLDGLVEQGRTIILVTHEDAVAAHARRVIHLADGLVDRDEPRPGPHP